MSERQTKAGNPAKPAKHDTLDMLNNFCFHIYVQKSLSHSLTVTLTLSLFLTLTLLQSLIQSLSTC